MPSVYPLRRICLLQIFTLLLCLSLHASEKVQTDIPQLCKQSRNAFAFIALGSGSVISSDGYVLTNNHVLGPGNNFGVTLGDGRSFEATVCGRDPVGDIALLKISGAKDLPYFKLGDSDKLQAGEFCLAIGNPLSMGLNDNQPTFTAGVISALHQFRKSYNDAIVTDAPINPGNSGGPLLNAKGEQIGVNGMTQTRLGLKGSTGIGYAIPSNQIKIWLPFLRLAQGSKVMHGRLSGLKLKENQNHVEVANVTGIAQASGFIQGDRILNLAGYPVHTKARFHSIEGMYPAGNTMTCTVLREGKEMSIHYSLPPLVPWRRAFTLARPKAGDTYPVISTVVPGTPAEKAGLLPADQLTAINGFPARASAIAHVSRFFSELNAGDEVKLDIERNGQKQSITFIAD